MSDRPKTYFRMKNRAVREIQREEVNSRNLLFQIEILDFGSSSDNHPHGASDHFAIKETDRWQAAPKRTLLRRAKSADCAKDWASRFGSVISCFKVDFEPYRRNIEFIKLEQPVIQMAVEDFTVNRSMELTREPHHEQRIRIEIVDNDKKP